MILHILILMLVSGAHADSGRLGEIKTIDSGGAEIKTVEIKGDKGTRSAAVGEALVAGDHVVAGHDVTVTMALRDGSQIVLAGDSEISVSEVADKTARGGSKLSLISGMLHALVKKIYSKDEPFMVEAGNCVMGVRGTEFVVERESSGRATLHTLEGAVAIARTAADLRSPKQAQLVKAGLSSSMNPGDKRPQSPKKFNPKTLGEALSTRAPVIAKVVSVNQGARVAAAHAAAEKVAPAKKAVAPFKPPKPKKVKAK